MGYQPQPASGRAITICLGYVNTPVMAGSPPAPVPGTGVNLTGAGGVGAGNQLAVYGLGIGFTLLPTDVGNVIMVMGAGPNGTPLWTTIASVTSSGPPFLSGTTADPSTQAIVLTQAVIYRPLTQYNTFYSGAYVEMGSIHLDSSLTTKTNFTFKIFSPSGAYLNSPIPGQPILAYQSVSASLAPWSSSVAYSAGAQVSYGDSYYECLVYNTNKVPPSYGAYWTVISLTNTALAYNPASAYVVGDQIYYYGQWFVCLQNTSAGDAPAPGTSNQYWQTMDVFGGMIQQVKPQNEEKSAAIEFTCECVAWDVLLTRAVLYLRINSEGVTATVDAFVGDGSAKSWYLSYTPVNVSSITEVSHGNCHIVGGQPNTLDWNDSVPSGNNADFSELIVGDILQLSNGTGLPGGTATVQVASINGYTTHITVTWLTGSSAAIGTGVLTWIGPSDVAGKVSTDTSLMGSTTPNAEWQSGDNFRGCFLPGNTIYINNATGGDMQPFVTTNLPLIISSPNNAILATDPGIRTNVGWRGAGPVTWDVEGGSVVSPQYIWNPTSNTITVGDGYAPLGKGRALYVAYTHVGQTNFTSATQTLSTVASALALALLPEGVTIMTVTGPSILSISFNQSDTFDAAFSSLCQFVSNGIINYWYYMDARRGLHIEEQAITKIAPWNVSTTFLDPNGYYSDGNVLLQVSNMLTTEKMSNAAMITTSNVQGSTTITDYIYCDGTKTTYTTSYPIGQMVSCTFIALLAGGQLVIPTELSAPGVQTGIQYGIHWSASSTTLQNDVTLGPLSGGYLRVIYYPIISTVQSYFNTSAIEARQAIEGGTGEYDIAQQPSSGTAPLLQATDISQAIAEYFSQLSETVEVKTYRQGLVPGQGIQFLLPGIAGINTGGVWTGATYAVESISMVDQENVLLWTVTSVRGAAIGDWRTAYRKLFGTTITTIGSGTGVATVPGPWSAGFETSVPGDAVNGPVSFGVAPNNTVDSGGNPVTLAAIYGVPPNFSQYDLSIVPRREWVSGPWAQTALVAAAASPSNGSGTITMAPGGGNFSAPNQFVGRIITKLANNPTSTPPVDANNIQAGGVPGGIPIANFLITANTVGGVFTVTPDPVAVGCVSGDFFTIRSGGPGAGGSWGTTISATSNSYTDPLFNTTFNLAGGLTPSGLGAIPDGNTGNVALVIGGKGAGQPPVVVLSNTATSVTVSDWTIIPDETSIIVLADAAPPSPTTLTLNTSSNPYFIGNVNIPNYSQAAVIRIEAYLENADGVSGTLQAVTYREIGILVAGGAISVNTDHSELVAVGTINCDTSGVSGFTDVLNGTITSGALTLIPTTDTHGVNGTNFTIAGSSEVMTLVSGAGTGTWTIARGVNGTTPTSHTNGATINLPGALTITLLASATVPNKKLAIVKSTADINYVRVLRGGTDTFPGGGTSRLITGNTTYYLQRATG